MPVVKDKLLILHKCLALDSFVSFNIFSEMLFIHVALLLAILDNICQWRRFGGFMVNFENISHLCSNISIVNFEHVIVDWVKMTLRKGSFR